MENWIIEIARTIRMYSIRYRMTVLDTSWHHPMILHHCINLSGRNPPNIDTPTMRTKCTISEEKASTKCWDADKHHMSNAETRNISWLKSTFDCEVVLKWGILPIGQLWTSDGSDECDDQACIYTNTGNTTYVLGYRTRATCIWQHLVSATFLTYHQNT